MSKTTIEWTQETWNPTRGCSRTSPGCVNCYAERQAARFCDEVTMAAPEPFHLFVERTPSGPRWTGKVELIEHMLEVPLRRRKPTTYFVNSMSDLFHEALPDEAIDRVFGTMALCPQHTFQVLTKRADRMRKWAHVVNWRIQSKWAYRGWEDPANRWPLPNVWLGVSVEDRQRKERIDRLRETPAAIRFVSFEPLLEDLLAIDLRRIDWAIWGGESGPKARPCDIEWIRRGMAQAYRDGCRNFVKQLGAHIVASNGTAFGWPINEAPGLWSDCSVEPPRIHVTDSKGGNPSEWPPEFRVREMPRLREPHPPIVQTQKT